MHPDTAVTGERLAKAAFPVLAAVAERGPAPRGAGGGASAPGRAGPRAAGGRGASAPRLAANARGPGGGPRGAGPGAELGRPGEGGRGLASRAAARTLAEDFTARYGQK